MYIDNIYIYVYIILSMYVGHEPLPSLTEDAMRAVTDDSESGEAFPAELLLGSMLESCPPWSLGGRRPKLWLKSFTVI